MSFLEKMAFVNGVLLATSEALPLLGKNITEATSLLTLFSRTLRHMKDNNGKHRR
jgi:hypothetical protein